MIITNIRCSSEEQPCLHTLHKPAQIENFELLLTYLRTSQESSTSPGPPIFIIQVISRQFIPTYRARVPDTEPWKDAITMVPMRTRQPFHFLIDLNLILANST
uniref:Uncharacterized protein n=1 Tax=Opuntia streptacantha TaxID=393608 RepID=A0A7C9AXG8_OPUST